MVTGKKLNKGNFMRMTFDVKKLKIMVNTLLANPQISQEQKAGAAITLEQVLHDTGNYKGFTHNDWDHNKTYEENKRLEYNRQYF